MIEVNLIAQRRAAQQRERSIALSLFGATVVCVLLLIVVAVGYLAQIASKRGAISATQANITKLLEQKAAIDEVDAEIQRKKPVLDLLEKARGSERDWLLAFRDIGQAIPQGVWLTSLTSGTSGGPRIRTASGGQPKADPEHNFSLRGEATSKAAVAEFQEALQNTDSIQETYLTSITSQTVADETIFQFELVATLGKLIGVSSK